jgi:hypothetical protein
MPEFTISFDVYCDKCGAGLCPATTVKERDGYGRRIYVEPCEACLRSEREEGKTDGYDDGYDNGYETGKHDADVAADNI